MFVVSKEICICFNSLHFTTNNQRYARVSLNVAKATACVWWSIYYLFFGID